MPEILPDPSDPLAVVLADIAELKRLVRAIIGANPLENAIVRRNGLVFADEGAARSDDFEAGVSGWRVGGDSAEFNDLTLRGGIIGNDALANPVRPAFGFDSGAGYAVPAGQANRIVRATFNFTVPDGFTQALISASAQDVAVNSTAGFDYLNSFVNITGSGGTFAFASSATVPAGYTGTSYAAITNLVTGLTDGATITVSSQPYTIYGAWASAASNSTILSATCLFLR